MTPLVLLVVIAAAADPSALPVRAARATSTLAPSKTAQYDVKNLLDGKAETAWCEGKMGTGEGERVTLEVGDVEVKDAFTVTITNGYQKSRAHLTENGAAVRMRIAPLATTGPLEVVSFAVPAELGPHTLSFPVAGGTKLKSVTLELEQIREGTKWSDTCISDVALGLVATTAPKTIVRLPLTEAERAGENASCRDDHDACFRRVASPEDRRSFDELMAAGTGDAVTVVRGHEANEGSDRGVEVFRFRVCPDDGDPAFDEDVSVGLVNLARAPMLAASSSLRAKGAPQSDEGVDLLEDEGDILRVECEPARRLRSPEGGDALVFASHAEGIGDANTGSGEPFALDVVVRLDYDREGRLRRARVARSGSTVGLAESNDHGRKKGHDEECTCLEPDVHPISAIETLKLTWDGDRLTRIDERTLRVLGADVERVERALVDGAKGSARFGEGRRRR